MSLFEDVQRQLTPAMDSDLNDFSDDMDDEDNEPIDDDDELNFICPICGGDSRECDCVVIDEDLDPDLGEDTDDDIDAYIHSEDDTLGLDNSGIEDESAPESFSFDGLFSDTDTTPATEATDAPDSTDPDEGDSNIMPNNYFFDDSTDPDGDDDDVDPDDDIDDDDPLINDDDSLSDDLAALGASLGDDFFDDND